MLRIISHIERLLLMHDCVIVPGFGGFVSQSVPAMWKKEEHLFIPPRKEIGFNETLHHSDGLLAESYMQLYNIDYDKAQQMLNDDVEDMKNDLKQYNKLSMGVIGTITLGEEGQVLFTPSETKLFSISSYGLSDLHMLPLSAIIKEQEEAADQHQLHPEKTDTLYIPVSRKLVRFVASTAAAIAAFLIISTPIDEVNKDTYKASFIPYEVVKPTAPVIAKAAPTYTVESEPAVTPKKETTAVSKKEIKTEKAKPTAVAAQPTQKAKADLVKETKKAPAKTTPAKSEKMFHAVIASFPDKKQADEYMQSIDRKQFASANVIFRNNKYRIYAKRFDNRKEANDYINTLHNNKKYKDAWLFISR